MFLIMLTIIMLGFTYLFVYLNHELFRSCMTGFALCIIFYTTLNYFDKKLKEKGL
jgi:hypothetical protein